MPKDNSGSWFILFLIATLLLITMGSFAINDGDTLLGGLLVAFGCLIPISYYGFKTIRSELKERKRIREGRDH